MSDLDWSELDDLRQLKEDHLREIKRLKAELAEVAKDRDIYYEMCGTASAKQQSVKDSMVCPGCGTPPHWCVCDGGARDSSVCERSSQEPEK